MTASSSYHSSIWGEVREGGRELPIPIILMSRIMWKFYVDILSVREIYSILGGENLHIFSTSHNLSPHIADVVTQD